MYIHASGFFHQCITDEVPNLKQEVKQSCGQHFRRIDRFIQLALIGAFRCAHGKVLNKNCGLYFSSTEADKTQTSGALRQVFIQHEDLMPLNFINLVSNAAAFYIAQALALQGLCVFSNSVVGALEKSLMLAELDVLDATCPQALVGLVDECAEPLALQRRLLQAKPNDVLGESSFWLLVDNVAQGAIAEITNNTVLNSWSQVLHYLQTLQTDNLTIAVGKGVLAQQQTTLKQCSNSWFYTETIAKQHGQIGYALHSFLSGACGTQHFLHIDRDKEGQFYILQVDSIPH